MIEPDKIVINARIHPLGGEIRSYQGMALLHGRIAALGTSEEMTALMGPSTEVVDLQGQTVIPGFNDAHCHPLSLRGKQLLQLDCSPSKVRDFSSLIALLSEAARRTPAGEWILAGSLDPAKLAEGRLPTRKELDRVSRDHPVHLRTQTCHIGVVNTAALERTGIDGNTPDPPGGVFDRESGGYPNGICREEAHFLFVSGMGKKGSFVPPYTLEERLRAIRLACGEMNAFGITSCGDALINPEEIEAFQTARGAGDLTCRTYLILLDVNLEAVLALKFRTGWGDELLRLGGIKSFADGATAGHTAWLSAPYEGELFEGRPDYRGIPTKSPGEIDALVETAHRGGFQVEVHANGDEAIAMVLDAFERAQRLHPRTDPRHRIAHCTVVTPELLKRIKALGATVLPFTSYVYEHGDKLAPYGDRIEMMFAHRSFLEAGIPVAGSSDNPCASANPFNGLYSMVTRRSSGGKVWGESQKISVRQALEIYTAGGAYATFEEGIKGALTPGMLADFAVLSADPLEVPAEELPNIRVLATYLGGGEVFRHPEFN